MNLRRRLRALFRRRDLEAEMAEEMRLHLEQRAADLAADGLPPAEANLAAQRRFGNTAALQEQSRDTFGWGALERFGQDLRFAARQLARSPGFTLLAVLTLGLGIGANTAMFSVTNGIMLKPLPYANRDRLERVWRATPQFREGNFAAADVAALREAQAGYGEFAAYRLRAASLADPGAPAELASSALATANFFSLLGVQIELGRAFRPGEDTPGRDKVVILSPRVWRNRYGADPGILGHTVRIDGEPHEIIGILPASFNDWRHLGGIDFFRPLALTPAQAADRLEQNIRVIGLRAPATDAPRASAFLADLSARQAQAFPAENAGTTWWSEDLIIASYGSPATLVLLIALSGFVLVLACANLANLYLVRTITRTREFAVRAALGASQLQLARPLVAESLLLSAGGGAVALAVIEGFHHWARIRSTGDNGEQVNFALDPKVLAWTVAASLLTALAFGLLPALYARRVDLNETLKSGGRGTTGGHGAQLFRRLLVVGQFALALVLLSGAAIFIRGLDDLHRRQGGWDATRLVSGTISLPAATYRDDDALLGFQRLALERLRALPGVDAASLASFEPYFFWSEIMKFQLDGQPPPAPGREPAARLNTVDHAYFATVGTPLVAGRLFDAGDTAASGRVYLVSQSTARALFPAGDALGRRLAPATDGAPAWGTIVGVVADVENVEPDANHVPYQIYRSSTQFPLRTFDVFVRVQGAAPAAIVPELRAAFAALDADLPVRALRPAQQSIARSLYQLGVLRDMLAAFGLLGLALAAMGIYGVLARTMAPRNGEFAIRLALGASARQIARLVFASGVRLALAGAVLGLVGAVGVTRVLTANYPGIRANSPLILAGAALFLLAVALLACWLPARRASQVDAISALRAE
jgi:putative ABC transport system permease protein